MQHEPDDRVTPQPEPIELSYSSRPPPTGDPTRAEHSAVDSSAGEGRQPTSEIGQPSEPLPAPPTDGQDGRARDADASTSDDVPARLADEENRETLSEPSGPVESESRADERRVGSGGDQTREDVGDPLDSRRPDEAAAAAATAAATALDRSSTRAAESDPDSHGARTVSEAPGTPPSTRVEVSSLDVAPTRVASPKPESSSSSPSPTIPTPSVSPNPPSVPVPPQTTTKRFSSSLSVNKKFLEKAGEKAHKPETKLATTRLATPTGPANPASTSHPRLLTGKISNSTSSSSGQASGGGGGGGGSTLHLSTKSKLGGGGGPGSSSSTTTTAGQQVAGSGAQSSSNLVNWGKGGTSGGVLNGSLSTAAGSANASGGPGSAGSGGTGGAVWNTAGKSAPSGPGLTTKVGTYGGIGLGRGGGGGGGFNLAAENFPTAAEAAHAKEARARAVMEQMQARERALQARAAAAAAQNANLLQNLDAFRGVHLDPNAHHWDEDEDDFLDTTIEFGDGTQYKITEEDAAAQQHEEAARRAQNESGLKAGSRADEPDALREPSPSELARLETPLGPGEVEETMSKSREERFGDDYDRSWPPKRPLAPPDRSVPPPSSSATRHAEKDDSNRNLFNDRLGKFEPAQHGQTHSSSAAAGRRRLSSGADRSSQDLPPHLAARRDSLASGSASAPRRPSITQKHHEPSPPVVRSAWPRRSSNDLPAPSHGRQLPPHLASASAAAAIPTPSPVPAPSSSASQVPPPSKVLSPPRTLAPLPEVSPIPVEPAQETEADLEALHAREMHAAAERAKKRRQEEEQARLEQIERAKKKAAELEEKMRQKEVRPAPKSTEAKVDDKAVEKGKEKSDNPWRTTAKPPAPSQARSADAWNQPGTAASRAPSSSASAQPSQPSSILPRPSQDKVPTTSTLPANQPATWRRSADAIPAASQPQLRQVPPHLAQRQSQAEPPAPIVTSPPLVASEASPVPTPPVPSAPIEKPSTPPPVQSPPTAPSSPSHDRRNSAKSPPLGYKVPEVSQLDDLMSRIKGAMTVKKSKKTRGGKQVDTEPDMDDAEEGKQRDAAPTVKLPPPVPATKLPRSRSRDQALTSTAGLSTEPRGRGRGRTEASRAPLRTATPTFETREPVLPFSGTRRTRSPSPPPAWKAYAVRIPPRSPLKAPHFRNVKQFLSLHNPRPVPVVFSTNLLITGINPRRLSRDDILIPKKWVKGVPQYPVKIPLNQSRITRRTQDEERALALPKPTPTVSISSKPSLVRATAADSGPSQGDGDPNATPLIETATSGSRGRGRGRVPDSGSWRRAGEPSTEIASASTGLEADRVQNASPDGGTEANALSRGAIAGTAALKSKLPLGSSIGFYRSPGAPHLADGEPIAMDRSDSAKMFMVTSELNGEKIAATPREETTAPGADLASRTKMTPSSPPFKPKDVSSVLSSPSAAWTNKSLALSVLDPTASSVWSAAPVDSTVHARTISENQPENSLQGILDDDPSEALPSSLAELKSEDGRSDEGKETVMTRPSLPSKDDAKLRAVAPSFSSFLHDSAAAIDTSTSVPPIPSFPTSQQSQAHHRPQPPLAFSGFASSQHSVPPASTPSPVNPYSPSTTAYPSYASAPYARSYGLTYGSPSGVSVSPFLSQPPPSHHQHFPPASPVASPLGYPSSVAPGQSPNLYARPLPSAATSLPHGITNPALIATYNGGYGGGQHLLNSAARYGAVGAGPRPNTAQSTGGGGSGGPPSLYAQQQQQQQQQHRPLYGGVNPVTSSYLGQPSPYGSTAPPPSSSSNYLPPPSAGTLAGGAGAYPYSSPSAPSAPPSYSAAPPLATSSYDCPPAAAASTATPRNSYPAAASAAARRGQQHPAYNPLVPPGGGTNVGVGVGGGGGVKPEHHHQSQTSHSTTTMPSPVIVPQHLPPPPPFAAQQQQQQQQQRQPSSSHHHQQHQHHQHHPSVQYLQQGFGGHIPSYSQQQGRSPGGGGGGGARGWRE